ncbi:MAG: glycosyltransferase family 2 protein, partial [Planctomycetes bacterium]|nr:glycosyltransferase family 2 protein [Planctomycetota bacterium]
RVSQPAIRTTPRRPEVEVPIVTPAIPRTEVIVLNWNGLEDTRAAIRSLLAQTVTPSVIHLVDNASDNDEADALEAEFGDVVALRRNSANLGFTGGHNPTFRQILREGSCEFVALLNNDAEADPRWLERMLEDARRHPDCGVFAGHMVFHARPEITENTGTDILTTGEAVPCDRNAPRELSDESRPRLGACGGAVLYRVEMLREIGGFRDDFFTNFEDVDLSLRALATGWDARFVAGAIVRHHLNRSIDKVRDDEFRIRSVRNLTSAYWINMPWPVILLNSPWLLLSYVVVPIVSPLLGQWDLCRILVRGRTRTLLEFPHVIRERMRITKLRRGSWWRAWTRIWWRQRSCFAIYWNFLVDVVVLRRRRYMQ